MSHTTFSIRKITPLDDAEMAFIIQKTMTEFGASGPGFSIHDTEVTRMSSAYAEGRHAYFVVTDGKKIYGGAGIAPLKGSEEGICELRKMYFLDELRGLGLGFEIMERCLKEARKMGFQQCYLETLKSMKSAEKLYLKCGFQPLAHPLGETGHFSCDSFLMKTL